MGASNLYSLSISDVSQKKSLLSGIFIRTAHFFEISCVFLYILPSCSCNHHLIIVELNIQIAGQKNLTAVSHFLTKQNLPISDLLEENVSLYLAYDGQDLVATIGLEKYGKIGLLRSLAVKETFRNQQIADKMIKGLFEVCKSENIKMIYLLTTTAENYFLKKGFLPVEREVVPAVIRQTREFRSICPSSAVVMYREV